MDQELYHIKQVYVSMEQHFFDFFSTVSFLHLFNDSDIFIKNGETQ